MIVGIDYDTYSVTVVGLPFDGPEIYVSRQRLRKASQTGRAEEWKALLQVYGAVLLALEEISDFDRGRYPEVAYIERGFGGSRRSDFSLGSIYGAIAVSLDAAEGHHMAINSIDLQEWKGAVTAVGLGKRNGNAKKEVAHEAIRAIAAEAGTDLDGLGPDELDAYGIAWAGREFNRRAFENIT